MGVESYYDSQARAAWVGKTVLLKGGGEAVVKSIRQTDGFRNPAMDYDFCLVLEDGSEVSPYSAKLKPIFPQTIAVKVEINEDDLTAGEWVMMAEDPEKAMSVEDLVRYHLNPALERHLHALRSRAKWHQNKWGGHPNLRKEEGHQLSVVTDQHGSEHSVMLPSGYVRAIRVNSPREGTWKCEGSPTEVCWYDNERDPAWDNCVFCGDAHERK